MNALIRSIDLKAGMYVVIRAWLDEKSVDPNKPMANLTVQEFRLVNSQRKPIGDPLRVMAVALPFMTVEFCCNRQRGVLDTRAMELMMVDLQYVQSLIPQYRPDAPLQAMFPAQGQHQPGMAAIMPQPGFGHGPQSSGSGL